MHEGWSLPGIRRPRARHTPAPEVGGVVGRRDAQPPYFAARHPEFRVGIAAPANGKLQFRSFRNHATTIRSPSASRAMPPSVRPVRSLCGAQGSPANQNLLEHAWSGNQVGERVLVQRIVERFEGSCQDALQTARRNDSARLRVIR